VQVHAYEAGSRMAVLDGCANKGERGQGIVGERDQRRSAGGVTSKAHSFLSTANECGKRGKGGPKENTQLGSREE